MYPMKLEKLTHPGLFVVTNVNETYLNDTFFVETNMAITSYF